MNINAKDSLKVIILAIVFYSGINLVVAQVIAPNSNTDAPINIGSTKSIKSGPAKVNTTLTSPADIGLNVSQGIQIFSTTTNNARLYINETGDTAGHYSGIELRKNGNRLGAFFKKGDANEANNDIAIWNSSKPVVSIKQNDVVEFVGPVKIRGGNPQAGEVLVSDSTGLATWKSVGAGQPSLSSTISQHWVALGQQSSGQAASSCPDGEVMVGFIMTVQGIKYGNQPPGSTGKVFCRKIISN